MHGDVLSDPCYNLTGVYVIQSRTSLATVPSQQAVHQGLHFMIQTRQLQDTGPLQAHHNYAGLFTLNHTLRTAMEGPRS